MEEISERPIDLLKMKIIMSDIKNILYGINNRLHTAKENISEPEDIKIKTIQNKSQRKKVQKKPTNTTLPSCQTISRSLITCNWSL